MKQTVEDDKLKDKISDADKTTITEKCKEVIDWLDKNQVGLSLLSQPPPSLLVYCMMIKPATYEILMISQPWRTELILSFVLNKCDLTNFYIKFSCLLDGGEGRVRTPAEGARKDM